MIYILKKKVCKHIEKKISIICALFKYTPLINIPLPNAIKWLPPKVGFEGLDVRNLTLISEKTNKEVVSD